MNDLFKRTPLIAGMILLVFIACISLTEAQPPSPPSLQDDDSMIRSLQKNGIKHETERAVLWVENGCLPNEEIEELGTLIDAGINKIEQYLGCTFDKEHYKGEDKIHYFIKDSNFIPHVYGAYNQRSYTKPMIFFPCLFIREKRAAYIHEAVHIVAWDFRSLWIREGLAVYLNDTLGGFPDFPNFGKDIDEGTKTYLMKGSKEVFRLIGQNGNPTGLHDVKKRREFYYLAGSFVKFFEGEIGIEKFMQIYKAKNTKKAIVEVTGKEVEEWKQAWLDSLNIQL